LGILCRTGPAREI
ncbi:peptidase M3 family protein, partial [Escherichia coli 96.0109]